MCVVEPGVHTVDVFLRHKQFPLFYTHIKESPFKVPIEGKNSPMIGVNSPKRVPMLTNPLPLVPDLKMETTINTTLHSPSKLKTGSRDTRDTHDMT